MDIGEDDVDPGRQESASFDTDGDARSGGDVYDSDAEPEPHQVTDLAAGALEAARAMASGKAPTGSGLTLEGWQRRRAARRRRRSTDGPTYSGARADGRDPLSIGAIVGKAMPELGWIGPLAEARLMTQWASVVGPEIAARCQPVSLVDGDLKVAAESTAWATQLRIMAPQILARITADLPRGLVKKIVITGPSGPTWKRGPWSVRGRGVRDTYG